MLCNCLIKNNLMEYKANERLACKHFYRLLAQAYVHIRPSNNPHPTLSPSETAIGV